MKNLIFELLILIPASGIAVRRLLATLQPSVRTVTHPLYHINTVFLQKSSTRPTCRCLPQALLLLPIPVGPSVVNAGASRQSAHLRYFKIDH